MPSSSKAQRNFMAAVAHSPAFAKKVGVSQGVGKDFNKADKGRKFEKGGDTMATKKPSSAISLISPVLLFFTRTPVTPSVPKTSSVSVLNNISIFLLQWVSS